MRGLYRRGKKWYCSIVDPTTGKLIRKPLSEDKQTAITILSNMKKDFDFARAGIAPKVSHVQKARPARVIMREYMDHMKTLGRSDSFFYDLDKSWRVVFEEVGVTAFEQCTIDRATKWAGERLSAGTKPQTINKRISALRSLFAWALKRGYIDQNPLATWEQLTPAEKNFRRDLTAEEVRRILDIEDDPEWRLRWLVYFFTGLRSSAGAALAWEWINFDEEIIVLPVENSKSKRTLRIPMHPELVTALRRWQEKTGRFVGPVYPLCHHSTILVRFKAICKKAGIDTAGVCMHSVRHTVATRIYESSGRNLKAVQEVLGHTNINTTAIYLHVSDAEKRAAVGGLAY